MHKVNIAEKFGQFTETWSPRIVAELNGQHVKVARLQGEFVWHSHEYEDELFWVVRGRLTLRLRDRDEVLLPGEMMVVPRGVEHLPVCEEETWVVLFEPATTVNTGTAGGERTVTDLPRI